MDKRIPRKIKKKLRTIALCLTGNPACNKSKYSKQKWVNQMHTFSYWLNHFNYSDRVNANQIK